VELREKNGALVADNQNLRRTWKFLTNHVEELEQTLKLFQEGMKKKESSGNGKLAVGNAIVDAAADLRMPAPSSVDDSPKGTILGEGYSAEPEPIHADGCSTSTTITSSYPLEHDPQLRIEHEALVEEHASALTDLSTLRAANNALEAELAALRREAVAHYKDNQRLRTESLALEATRKQLDERLKKLSTEHRRSNSLLSVKTLELSSMQNANDLLQGQGSGVNGMTSQRRGTLGVGGSRDTQKANVEDVTRLVERLNDEIFQTAAHIADSAGHVYSAVSGDGIPEAATETLKLLLGEDILPVIVEKIKSAHHAVRVPGSPSSSQVNGVAKEAGYDREEGCPIEIVQAAIQTCLVRHCIFATNRWTSRQSKNEWMSEIWAAVRNMTGKSMIKPRQFDSLSTCR
jgi:hypothetical protein